MFSQLFLLLSAAEFTALTMACMSTTSTVPLQGLIGEPGDPGYPGPPGQMQFMNRGKREIDVSKDVLYFMTQETNFKRAEKLVEIERENLLSKLKSSKSVYNQLSPELQQPLVFGSDGGYLSAVINLEILQDWNMCYFFAEKVMLLNNEDSSKGVKTIVTCNGEQFY